MPQITTQHKTHKKTINNTHTYNISVKTIRVDAQMQQKNKQKLKKNI